jgi:NAD(P)-dependent dehydrogenase (short-subunit alcohol dehydrogenase family)
MCIVSSSSVDQPDQETDREGVNEMKKLEDKVALVTGGSTGIGQANALAFAREGANVVIADIHVEVGMETVQIIEKAGGNAIFVKTDVSQTEQVQALIEKTVETYGRLDCASNNTGIEGEKAPTAECSEENWSRVIGTNLKGIWLCMKYEIIQMLSQGTGSIVNMLSASGLLGNQKIADYMVGLTKAVALEYATAGIRINAVCPDIMRTAMVDPFTCGDPEIGVQLAATKPTGRLDRPEEVTETVVWLCSKAASFLTGIVLPIDG